MGMFTTVIRPETGERIQFKCGHDNCETYGVGDAVNHYVVKDRAGEGSLLDDVYDGESYYGPDRNYAVRGRYWVVIKDGKVHAVEPVEPPPADKGVEWGVFNNGYRAQYARVYVKYGLKPHDTSWWPPEAWAEKARRDAASEYRSIEFEAETYGMSAEQAAGRVVQRLLQSQMRQEGFLRKVLPPVPVEGSAAAGDGPVKVLDVP